MIAPFQLLLPGRILFGRGEAAKTAGLAAGFGPRVLLVHGRDAGRAAWLRADLDRAGSGVQALTCATEPDLPMLEAALARGRVFAPDVVIGLGGGAVLDLAKTLAALIPATGAVADHLEGVGQGRKVSLRDDRMMARLAIVDPALTDSCPRGVTLASGLDALTQVIEPYLCNRANPGTDALARAAIPMALAALPALMQGEDAAARDAMAWVSLSGGIALANAGLGAVHGLAGVIGGMTGAAHGAICGTLLPFVIAANRAALPPGPIAERLSEVDAMLSAAFGGGPGTEALHRWSRRNGLPGLSALGLDAGDHGRVAAAAVAASSMKANPVVLSEAALQAVLRAAR